MYYNIILILYCSYIVHSQLKTWHNITFREVPTVTNCSLADDELYKAIITLQNKKTSLIKKRQLMRAHCGDYRDKMALQTKSQKNRMYN